MIMKPQLRKGALTAHLALSIGWFGAIVAYLTLDITVATSRDAETVRAAWIAMDSIVAGAIMPLAVASLLTGVLVSLGTRWGLFRHWWVLISFLLTAVAAVVLVSEAGLISRTAALATAAATTNDHLLALPSTLPHSVGGLLVLVVVQVLNVYKPRGLTRYGWRKQQEERAALQLRPRD